VSARPIEVKQRRRAAKALRRSTLPAYINLIEWLKDRRYASTTGEAQKILLAGRVQADSHKLGVKRMPVLQADQTIREQDVVQPIVPAELRSRIIVTKAKA
jgi:hypothetical protein